MENNCHLPLVSVFCLVYNHENYIRECLDHILSQHCDFRYEVIVHDDASTDNSAEIIKEYENKYPGIIVPIYQTHNQYKEIGFNGIIKLMHERSVGKYVALCEGDDYWTDSLKLQKQVKILESDSCVSLVIANGLKLKASSKDVTCVKINPFGSVRSGYVDNDMLFKEENHLIPTASMIFRTQLLSSMPEFFYTAPVSDKPIRMWCAINGSVYYFSEPMTFYRTGTSGSFSQSVSRDCAYAKHICDGMLTFLHNFNIYTDGKYADVLDYMRAKELHMYYGRVGDLKSLENSPFLRYLPVSYRLKSMVKKIVKRYLYDQIRNMC